MKRYSYLVGGLGRGWKPEDEQSQLNELGERGWELVSVIIKPVNGIPCTFFYFRREKHDNATADNATNPLGLQGKKG
jgi:hypothetical protein